MNLKNTSGNFFIEFAEHKAELGKTQIISLINQNKAIAEYLQEKKEEFCDNCDHQWGEPYKDDYNTGKTTNKEHVKVMGGWVEIPLSKSRPVFVDGYSRSCLKCWKIQSRPAKEVKVSPF